MEKTRYQKDPAYRAKCKESQKKYYLSHKKERDEYRKKYNELYPEKVRAWRIKYRAKNRDAYNKWFKEWRKKNREKIRQYYLKSYEKVKANRTLNNYYTSEKYNESRKKYKKLYPEKFKAWNKANDLQIVKNSDIGQLCYFCGNREKLQKHHQDYSKPLDIIWLCHSCHSRLHAIDRLR